MTSIHLIVAFSTVAAFFSLLFGCLTLLVHRRRRQRREIDASLVKLRNARHISGPTMYKITGKVWKESDDGMELLASGSTVKPGESAVALKDAWKRDMQTAFPRGPDYDVHYECVVREHR